MNNIQKISRPLRRLSSTVNPTLGALSSRSIGCVHLAADVDGPAFYEPDTEQIVHFSCPKDLEDLLGIDKYFAETRGSQILLIAATRKLLLEEKLRQTLQGINTPLDSIVKEHFRWKPSKKSPICPVTQEEL